MPLLRAFISYLVIGTVEGLVFVLIGTEFYSEHTFTFFFLKYLYGKLLLMSLMNMFIFTAVHTTLPLSKYAF